MNESYYKKLMSLDRELTLSEKDFVARYEYFNRDPITDINSHGESISLLKLLDVAKYYIEEKARKYYRFYDDIKQECIMDIWTFLVEDKYDYQYAQTIKFGTVVVPIIRNATQKILSQSGSYNLDTTSHKKLCKIKKMQEEGYSMKEICLKLKISENRYYALLSFSSPVSLNTVLNGSSDDKVVTLEDTITDTTSWKHDYDITLGGLKAFLLPIFKKQENVELFLDYHGINAEGVTKKMTPSERQKVMFYVKKIKNLPEEKQEEMKHYLAELSNLKQ